MLIILLMITPMRSVTAGQVSHCDTDEMSNMTSASHQMHMSQADIVDSHQDKQQNAGQDCCCCDADSCASNCDMGMTTSILMQNSTYTPVFVSAVYIELFSSKILARALTPPTRPPLKFS
jgi:hypothetical protein